MKRKILTMATAGLVTLALTGCMGSSQESSATPNTTQKTTKKASTKSSGTTKIPRSSKLSKIRKGMSRKQVYDLIGAPTDSHGYSTGKSWIPFYYGGDRYRWEDLYKRQGRIIYTGRNHWKVHEIIYDPKETGYVK